MTDTGPDLSAPQGGSSAIGVFEIGVSPIGTIEAFDYWDTVISQYANSPVLTTIIANLNQCIDQTANLDAFFDDIWNILTAQGAGLDIWGRILGVTRTLHLVNPGTFLGFESAEPGAEPFDQAPFFAGETTTTNFNLTDPAYLVLLLAKAFANISDGSAKSVNIILKSLFPGRGNAYATDGLDMTMTYTFDFILTPVELAIVSQSGVLPRPAGVASSIIQI